MQGQQIKDSYNCKTKLPNDMDKIWFVTTKTRTTHIGYWIESEKMFFIGFGNKGDFKYPHEIEYWGYLDDEDLKLVEKGVYKSSEDVPDMYSKVIFKLINNEQQTLIGEYIKSEDAFLICGKLHKRDNVSIW